MQRILADIPPPLPADLVRLAVTEGGSENGFSKSDACGVIRVREKYGLGTNLGKVKLRIGILLGLGKN